MRPRSHAARRRLVVAVVLASAAALAADGCAELRELPLASADGGTGSDARSDAEPPLVDAATDEASPPPAGPIVCGDVSGLEPGAPWPTLSYCNTRAARSPAPRPKAPRVAWSYRFGGAGGATDTFLGAPVVAADGAIYAIATRFVDGSLERLLVGVHPDGSEKFIAPVPTGEGFVAPAATPSIGRDGTLYTSVDGVVAAWAPSGTVRWSKPIGRSSASAPAILGDGTVVVAAGSSLEAFTAAGDPRWTYAGDGSFFVGSVAVTPTGLVLASEAPAPGALAGSVHFVTGAGARARVVPLTDAPETLPLVVDDGRVVLRTRGAYWVLSPTGDVVLQRAGAGPNDPWPAPAFSPPIVWFTGARDVPSLLDLDAGTVTTASLDASYTTAAAVFADGTVTFGALRLGKARLVAVDPAGAIVWEVPLEPTGADPLGPALGRDGTVYLPWGNVLYAVRD